MNFKNNPGRPPLSQQENFEAWVMYYLEGSYAKAAATLFCSPGAVRQRVDSFVKGTGFLNYINQLSDSKIKCIMKDFIVLTYIQHIMETRKLSPHIQCVYSKHLKSLQDHTLNLEKAFYLSYSTLKGISQKFIYFDIAQKAYCVRGMELTLEQVIDAINDRARFNTVMATESIVKDYDIYSKTAFGIALVDAPTEYFKNLAKNIHINLVSFQS